MPGPHGFAVRSNPSSPKGSPGYGAVVLRAVVRSRENSPCEHTRADAAASTASPPAFVTIAIRPSCRERTGRAGGADLPDGESGIFFAMGLDRFWLICPSARLLAHQPSL